MGKIKDLKNITLSDIELGNADGEKESSNKNFQGYFYDRHSDYTLLKNNYDKFIVTGKKGSGKTYLVKYLENKLKSQLKNQVTLSKTIKWKDINLNSLIELGKQKVDCECESFYKYIILIEIARLILETNIQSITMKTKNPFKVIGFCLKRRKLKMFYKKRYPEGNYSISRIKTKDRNLEKVDMDASLNGLNSTSISEFENEKEIEYREKNVYEIIEELEELVFKCLKYISVFLISDDLDEQGLNVLSNQNFRIFLINYLNAANNLNLELKLYKSKVIIVIRDDILDTLNAESSNINKLITDSTIQIDWCEKSRKKAWEYDISKMILNKIRVSANIDDCISDKELYIKFFGKTIDNDTQIDYLISRSLGRPRDLIVYLNKIKEQFPEEKEFLPAHYRDVAASYSKYFINEFKNELRIYYENDTIEQIFNMISDLNKSRFSFNDINNFYQKNKSQFDKLEDLKTIISRLYKIGLLGNDSDGAVSFYYRKDGKNKANFNDNAKFLIHYGAKKALIAQINKKRAKQN